MKILATTVLVATIVLLAIGLHPTAGVIALIAAVIGGATALMVLPGVKIDPSHCAWLALVAGGLLLTTFYFGILPSQADPGLRGWLLVVGAGLALVAAAHPPARRIIGRWAVWMAVVAAIIFLLGGRQRVGERIGQLTEWRPVAAVATTAAVDVAAAKEVKIVLASNGRASFDLGAWVTENPRHRFWEVFFAPTVRMTLPDGSASGHFKGAGNILFSGPAGEKIRIVFYTSRPGG